MLVVRWSIGNAKIVVHRCVGQPEALRSEHYHGTHHDEPGIERVPRPRGRWRLPRWKLPRARGTPYHSHYSEHS